MRSLSIARRALAALALTVSLGVASRPALAQNTDEGGERKQSSGGLIVNRPGAGYGTGFTISALGGIGSYGNTFGVGFGGIFGIPIVRDGFIPSLNESFHLEFGLFTNVGFGSFRDFVYMSPFGGVRWDFHIVRDFTAYAALRTGVALGIDNVGSDFYFDGVVGGFWRFSQPVALRFELGGGVVGSGISGGVAFFL